MPATVDPATVRAAVETNVIDVIREASAVSVLPNRARRLRSGSRPCPTLPDGGIDSRFIAAVGLVKTAVAYQVTSRLGTRTRLITDDGCVLAQLTPG
jgi:hypothetical protein